MSAGSRKRRQARRRAEAASLNLTMPEFAALERALQKADARVEWEESCRENEESEQEREWWNEQIEDDYNIAGLERTIHDLKHKLTQPIKRPGIVEAARARLKQERKALADAIRAYRQKYGQNPTLKSAARKLKSKQK